MHRAVTSRMQRKDVLLLRQSNAIMEITGRKSATITLDELSDLCNTADYGILVSDIRGLVDSGILKPMGKETNGMYPPLRNHYRIIREDDDASDAKDEIMRLGPDFNPSGYLAKKALYVKHRGLLRCLCEYVRRNSGELDLIMSKNERAYAVWGNEKQLDDALCKSMLRFTGWDERLNYYDTPEPFLDYLCAGANTESVLILENKDIWFSLRKLFMESKAGCLLYGVKIDGLLYGEGKKITRVGALKDYSKEGFARPPSFYYWGDLDYEGISIFLAVSKAISPEGRCEQVSEDCRELPVRLFTPGYMAMLGYAKTQTLTQRRTAQVPPTDMERFLECFDSVSALEIRTLLESGEYIPQEICSLPRLRDALEISI